MSNTREKTDTLQEFEDGALIVKQGEEADKAYLIKGGRVWVYREDSGEKEEIALLGVGQIFGEMAVIKNYKHTANVAAVGKVTVVPITAETINKRLETADTLVKTIVNTLIDRLYNENFKER